MLKLWIVALLNILKHICISCHTNGANSEDVKSYHQKLNLGVGTPDGVARTSNWVA